MAIDEKTKRALAVHRLFQEKTMSEAPSIMKRRKIPNGTASTVREIMAGSRGTPRFVAVQFEGDRTPDLLVSEALLEEMAPSFGGDERVAAAEIAARLFAYAHGGDSDMRPHGLFTPADGKLTMSAEGAEGMRAAHGIEPGTLEEGFRALVPEWDGKEGADDRAIVLGPHACYMAREYDQAGSSTGKAGRLLAHSWDEMKTIKAARDGGRIPANVVRTLRVSITGEPTEEELDEANAFEPLLRRHRRPGRSHDE